MTTHDYKTGLCPNSKCSCHICQELTAKEREEKLMQAQQRKIRFHRFLLWLAKHGLYTPTITRDS